MIRSGVRGWVSTGAGALRASSNGVRSEEHTSELQSPDHLVCRLLLEKKKEKNFIPLCWQRLCETEITTPQVARFLRCRRAMNGVCRVRSIHHSMPYMTLTTSWHCSNL